MTTQTPDISDLIAEMDETYAAVDRELREYSRLCNELPRHRMREAHAHRAEADRLTGVAHEIQDRIMARLGG